MSVVVADYVSELLVDCVSVVVADMFALFDIFSLDSSRRQS